MPEWSSGFPIFLQFKSEVAIRSSCSEPQSAPGPRAAPRAGDSLTSPEAHGNAKECSNYRTIALISHASKVMLKILQARFQQYVNCELQMFKLDLEKAEEPEIKLPLSAGSCKKQESSRKISTALLTMPKPLTVWTTTNCGKFLEMGIPDHLTCLLRNRYTD